MRLYYIYKITNTINNKSYVGFTVNPTRRFKQHVSKKYNSKISYAIQKYGKDNFLFEIIYVSKERDHTLNIMEKYFIEYYNTFNNGYNLTLGGEALCGEANYMYGKYHSEITKQKISERAKGRISPRKGAKLSDESKRKISEANKGKQARLGSKLSEETKEKIRLKNIGKQYGEEVNNKKGRPGSLHNNYGKKLSKEIRNKISQAQQNRKDNEILINGIIYRSKRQARELLKVSYKTLEKLISN